MLTVLSARSGSEFSSDTIGFLLDLVGPHPHFLQVAGYSAFRLQKKGVLSADDRSALKELALDELKGHLEYYWRDLSADEQYTLAALPLMAFEGYSPMMERLAENGLIHENKYLGAVLREFVARQSVDGVLRVGAFAMDERRRLITADGKRVHLTPTEFAAMRLLMQSPGEC
jgi:hypothetical protein